MNQPPTRNDSLDEPARDAWLSEALRHAPDADAAPSVAVRETILRQARAAAASSSPPRPGRNAWQRINAVWSSLSGPRVAAAFASVMVATVVGLMWWDLPIDEALRPVEPPATVAAPAAVPAPAQTPTSEPPASLRAPAAEAARDQAPAAPPRAAPERKREAVKSRAGTSNDARREAPAAPAAPRAADETRALADAPDTARADKDAREVDLARERRAENAQAKAAAPALRSAPSAATGMLYAPAPAAAPAPIAPGAAAAQSTQARPAPLAGLLEALAEALAEKSPRWQWQREGAGERTLTPELRAWLQRLDHAVAGRWSSVDPGQESAPAQAQGLRLLHDGGLRAIVRLGTDGTVRIDIAGEAPLVAQLPPASAAALRRALDDATR
jgi:hypothetical protein